MKVLGLGCDRDDFPSGAGMTALYFPNDEEVRRHNYSSREIEIGSFKTGQRDIVATSMLLEKH